MIAELESPTDLRLAYPLLSEAVDQFRSKTGITRWIAPDYYMKIMRGDLKAALMVSDADQEPLGIACWAFEDDGSTAPIMHMDLVYVRTGAPRACLDELDHYITQVAAGRCAVTIRFDTVRTAWARRVSHLGYKQVGIILEKEV